jgi:hypothetical protein
MKRWAVLGFVAVMLSVFSSVSYAGDRARGRWEGFAIGLGAVTVYNLFEHGIFSPVIPPQRVYEEHVYHQPPVVYRTDVYHHGPVVYEPRGHWEIYREWVPKSRERVWVPRHREKGYWVRGHHQVRDYPGRYVKRRVWIERGPHEPGRRVKKGPPSWAPAHGYRANR